MADCIDCGKPLSLKARVKRCHACEGARRRMIHRVNCSKCGKQLSRHSKRDGHKICAACYAARPRAIIYCHDCGKELNRRAFWTGTKHCGSCSKLGIVLSEECKKKIGLANMGKHSSPETGIKISRAKMGHSVSAATRQKISVAHQGIPNSAEQNRKIGDAHRGERHYNWKGGPTNERDRIEVTPEYRAWRMAVFSRDDYTCQYCFGRGGKLDAHHVNSFRKYPELRIEINNGLTLCHACHLNLTRGELQFRT